LQDGVVVLKLLLSKGLTESARCFNSEQKYKHIRLLTVLTWQAQAEVLVFWYFRLLQKQDLLCCFSLG